MRILSISVILLESVFVNGKVKNFLDGYADDSIKKMIYESMVRIESFREVLDVHHMKFYSETIEIDITITWEPQLGCWYFRVRIRSFTAIWYVAIYVQRLCMISTISTDWHHYDSCKFQFENWVLTQSLLKNVAFCQLSSWLYCWNLLNDDVTNVFKSLSPNKNFVTLIICQISFLLISSKSQLRPDPLCEFLYKSEDDRMLTHHEKVLVYSKVIEQ